MGNEVSLHALVWEGAHATSRPYLLVHGLASNCRTWEGVARRLCEHGHPVAAVDLRGHGQSDKPDHGYDFATMAADLLAAIAVLRFEEPVVAGQSTGGNLAVELAHRAPDAIAGAAGVDGGALELQQRWPRWEDCQEALAPPGLAGMPVDEYEAIVRRRHPDWSDWGIAATVANMEIRADGTIRPWLTYERHLRVLRALWEHRPSVLLPDLAVPLLLVMAIDGDDEPTPRPEMALTNTYGPQVNVEWMGGDHDLHVEHPVALADLFEKSFPS